MNRLPTPAERAAPGPSARAGSRSATAASVLAAAYLLSTSLLPAVLPLVTVGAAAAGCALVLTHRRGHALRLVLAALSAWLAAAFGGVLLLHDRPLGGLAWLASALFVVPLPLVPWLYARTFRAARSHPPSSTGDGGDRP